MQLDAHGNDWAINTSESRMLRYVNRADARRCVDDRWGCRCCGVGRLTCIAMSIFFGAPAILLSFDRAVVYCRAR